MYITKGTILSVDSKHIAKVKSGGVVKLCKLLYQEGFYKKPAINNTTECLILSINGSSQNLIAIPFNVSNYPNIDSDEVIIQNQSSNIKINVDGSIIITAGSSIITITQDGSIDISGTTINITGDLVVSGNITSATATIGGKDFATHIHSGVTSGSANTGVVV